VHDMLEDACLRLAPRLLIDGRPRRKIVRQIPPLTARSHHVRQSVERVWRRILALESILAHQTQVRERELPFCICEVAGTCRSRCVHTLT
jgi:hypothetical protein